MSRARSEGASSTWRPRRPALTWIVSKACRAAVEDRRQRPSLPQRADAADDVAGHPLGGGRLGHRGLAAADSVGEALEVEIAGDRHDRDHETVVDRRDERLEHPLGGQAEGRGRLEAVRMSSVAPGLARIEHVLVDGVRDAGRGERDQGRGAFRHVGDC